MTLALPTDPRTRVLANELMRAVSLHMSDQQPDTLRVYQALNALAYTTTVIIGAAGLDGFQALLDHFGQMVSHNINRSFGTDDLTEYGSHTETGPLH
jgi:hypothetical protein